MVLLGQFPEGCLDFVIASLRSQAECSIEITQELPRAAIMEQVLDAVRPPSRGLKRTTGIGLYG
jgi:hypothetical protein